MKNHNLILPATIIFVITLAIASIPAILPVLGVSGNSTTFNVTLTVSSGSPTIIYVYNVSDSPSEGTTKIVQFYFNASHPNGVANIPASGAQIKVNQSGVIINSTSCSVFSTDSLTLNMFNCSITLNYYNLPGAWTINATVMDLAGNNATNTSGGRFTNGNTYGIVLKTSSLAFSGTPGQTVGATANPQYVNNTGNTAYTQINLTSFNLQSGTNFIGAGNFTANTTDGSGAGRTLANNTGFVLTASSVAVQGSRDIYLYLTIPNGVSNGTYSTVSPWVVTLS